MSVKVVEPKSSSDVVKLLGLGALSLGLNYLIFSRLLKPKQQQSPLPRRLKKELMTQIINQEKSEIDLLSSKKQIRVGKKEQQWGSVKLINDLNENPLLKELKLLDSLLCEVSRVNHLIVDLQLTDFQPHVNALLTKSVKKKRQQPFLAPQAMVSPGQFVIKQCRFTSGNSIELEKKYMRAGPRGTQFFHPEEVKADIVCLGSVCPGVNTVIRQITIMLKDVYKVNKVTGVKNGFNGYNERKFVELTMQNVETVHHFGGCSLGLCETELHLNKVIDSLIERNINQVYLIGANKTMRACHALHSQIKKRKLAIAVCVLLKGINRDVPIFDGCFGFQTAVEQSSKLVERAYAFSHSYEHGISLVKLPGYNSGFLASYTVLATINTNICLVPEFQFDMHGPNGLLSAVIWRLKNKGSVTIVYSEGCENSLRDCCIKKSSKDETITQFDNFLKDQIEKAVKEANITPYQIGVFNAIYSAKSAPANAFDTKLCCQIAQGSVMGVMAGYTNFAVGHLANRSTMISVDELIMSESSTQLREHDYIWQETIMTTGQPTLKNDVFTIKSP